MPISGLRISYSNVNKRKPVNLNLEPEIHAALPLAATLAAAESRLLDRTHPASYRVFESLLRRMQVTQEQGEAQAGSSAALRLCQHLYANARSFDALPFGRANVMLAEHSNDVALMRRSHTACGLLLADTADIAGAIEHHTHALRLAAAEDDAVEISRVWNNIGGAFCISGNFSLSAACFRRVQSLLHAETAPIFSRYAAFGNLAHCLYHLNEIQEGLQFAAQALEEMTSAFFQQDPHGALLLHRNCVKLYLAAGQLPEAKRHVEEVVRMAARAATPRAAIAASTTQAAYEMACGDHDLGLTRLDQALVLSRAVPATLRDTLVSVVRAEDNAGFPAHALVRLHELSDHIYHSAIAQTRRHVEIAELMPVLMSGTEQAIEQTRARLTSRLLPPDEPTEWKTLQRLAVGAAMRVDSTGWHGIRVGVLTQALAREYRLPPLQALEFGLAAQLHDIGMASVPERVLMQPGALNPTERALVRKHTTAGAEMLSGDDHPRIVIASDIVKYHHARWDGEGYPTNVAGKSIPLAARMCAVADVYDTLVTDRPYRKAWSMDKALGELQRVAGTQLDPELVRCFEVVIRRESANEGIDPSMDVDGGLENFQQLIAALNEDRGFL